MITGTAWSSTFFTELAKDGEVTVTHIKGPAIQEERWPVCQHGVVLSEKPKMEGTGRASLRSHRQRCCMPKSRSKE